ncbi:MAG: hypothetical protein QF516_14020, partial [Pirellulaceae bacterium]|nr:hypothetical protein [Pirellulaceae bacterium]
SSNIVRRSSANMMPSLHQIAHVKVGDLPHPAQKMIVSNFWMTEFYQSYHKAPRLTIYPRAKKRK